MATDAYQPCPCGIDKKIKFCCGSEVLADLEKVEEALGGEQRLGALDLVNRLLSQKPDRPCLQMYKAMVQLGMKETDAARATVEEMLRQAPGNPAGLALAAILDCHEDRVEDGVEKLQGALESQHGQIVNAVYEAIGVVGRSLVIAGEPIAAQAHLLLQVTATRGQDQNALMALFDLEGSGEIPLQVQGVLQAVTLEAGSTLAAADVPEFNAGLRLADLGCWLAAARNFESLAQKYPGEPAIWRNIGVLRARLINNGVAIEALRKYAQMPAVPRDLAVEAEALAQYLSEPTDVDFVNELTATYAVPDVAALKERLTTSKRVQSIPLDPAAFQEANEPPPQSAYLVLDREIPATSPGLSRDNVPKVVGEALLYGKETDRPARLEFISLKTADYDAKTKAVLEATGPLAGPKLGEEVSGKMVAASSAMSINWRFPDETPIELRKKLIQEQRMLALLSIWPNLPMSALDGKTPRVAVATPAGQNRVLAVILAMDLAEPEENPDFNKLRRSLGLPTVEPIEPAGVRVTSLTPAQQTRLVMAKVSDDDLLALYRRGMAIGAPRLVRKLAHEVVARPTFDKHAQVSKAEAYEILARTTPDSDESLAMLLKAQEAAKAKGQSPARFLLSELPLRLRRQEEVEAKRVLNTLMSKHMREPGIERAVLSLLAQLGILQVDPATGRATIAGQPVGGMASPVAAAASPGGLWTPDQIAAPAPAGGSKSKLWVPGMD